jgi:hypothetical protein
MLNRATLLDKSLIRFVLVRTVLLAVAFSVGFNLIIVSDLISVPVPTRKLFMHNWGYLLLSYALLLYAIGLYSLRVWKGIHIGFRGIFWITGFHAMGSLLFLGKVGKVGLIIGAVCYGLALVLLYLWEVVFPHLVPSVAALPLPPFVQERIPKLKAYFQAKPSAPFILSFMGLLMVCAFLLIFKLEKAAEHVANVAYFALVIGVGIEVYQLIKTGGQEEDGSKDAGSS